eukprot:364181-Chlamydomonas_euryale.AAC.2
MCSRPSSFPKRRGSQLNAPVTRAEQLCPCVEPCLRMVKALTSPFLSHSLQPPDPKSNPTPRAEPSSRARSFSRTASVLAGASGRVVAVEPLPRVRMCGVCMRGRACVRCIEI